MAVDEKTLRDAKDVMLGSLTGIQADAGMVPDVRKMEAIVNPVIASMEHHEDTSGVREPMVSGHVVEGEIELERIDKSNANHTVVATSREATKADYAWARRKRNPLDVRVQVQDAIRTLMEMPEWKARLVAIASSNMNHDERGKAYQKIMTDAVRVFGEIAPIEREKKIIVGAL